MTEFSPSSFFCDFSFLTLSSAEWNLKTIPTTKYFSVGSAFMEFRFLFEWLLFRDRQHFSGLQDDRTKSYLHFALHIWRGRLSRNNILAVSELKEFDLS
jgi:hypothetical protein